MLRKPREPQKRSALFPFILASPVGGGGPYTSSAFFLEERLVPKPLSFRNPRRGAWVAQSVKHPTSAQVMISWFVSSSPASDSLLSAQSLLQILCPPLSLCPSPAHAHGSLSQKKINIEAPGWLSQLSI